MLKIVAGITGAALIVSSQAMAAEPIRLKLSFFSSDRSVSYLAAVKPFVDAVNAEAKGLIEIEPHVSGVLSRDLTHQPKLLRDGIADLAYVVPGVVRDEFKDNTVIELPGLYRDMREATTVFTRMIAANAIPGYDDFVVVGAYVTDPETFHCRVPVASLEELKDKRVRVNNPMEITAMEKLGAVPVLMQVHQISDNLSSGKIDCALVPPSPLDDYGIKRVATHHYLLGTSGAPLMLLMNRKKFEALPETARHIISKYSGEWAAESFIKTYSINDQAIIEQLRADPKRKVIVPPSDDIANAQAAFASVSADWIAKDPRNRSMLQAAQAEIEKLRAGE